MSYKKILIRVPRVMTPLIKRFERAPKRRFKGVSKEFRGPKVFVCAPLFSQHFQN